MYKTNKVKGVKSILIYQKFDFYLPKTEIKKNLS